MVANSHNTNLQERKARELRFKAILDNIAGSRIAWATKACHWQQKGMKRWKDLFFWHLLAIKKKSTNLNYRGGISLLHLATEVSTLREPWTMALEPLGQPDWNLTLLIFTIERKGQNITSIGILFYDINQEIILDKIQLDKDIQKIKHWMFK